MTLKDGKFYDGDKVVPLEFGNKEQINLIESVQQLKDEGAIPTMIFDEEKNFICGALLECVCGGSVHAEWASLDESCEVEGTKVKCSGCSFIYEVKESDYDFMYFQIVATKTNPRSSKRIYEKLRRK